MLQQASTAAMTVAPVRAVDRPARLRRVLYLQALSGSQKFGSMEEQALLLARAARDRGGVLLPAFLTPLDAESRACYEREGLRSVELNLWRFQPRVFRRVAQLIREEQIEVVHWNFYLVLKNGYFWSLKARFPHVKHIWTNHTSIVEDLLTGRGATLRRLTLGGYEHVLGVSDFIQNDMQRRWHLHKAGRFYHFVNTDRFRPAPEVRARVREEQGAGEAFVAVVVATLISYKGVDVAIRALSQAPSETQLWIIGDGAERESLEALAEQLGVASRVRFLGLQRCVEPFLQAADVLICPSIWGEAAGLANIEALSCGLPVLASRVGAIPEFVRDGETGYLFPPGDHKALARLVGRLHQDPTLRRDLGARARADAVARFSPDFNIARNLALYEA